MSATYVLVQLLQLLGNNRLAIVPAVKRLVAPPVGLVQMRTSFLSRPFTFVLSSVTVFPSANACRTVSSNFVSYGQPLSSTAIRGTHSVAVSVPAGEPSVSWMPCNTAASSSSTVHSLLHVAAMAFGMLSFHSLASVTAALVVAPRSIVSATFAVNFVVAAGATHVIEVGIGLVSRRAPRSAAASWVG